MVMRVVSVKIDDDMIRILEDLARKYRTTKSEIIRRALRQYLEEQEDKPFITKRMKIYI